MKKFLYIAMTLFLFLLSGCGNEITVKPPEATDVKIEKEEREEVVRIITTNKLLFYMVKDIVREKQMVDYMLKSEEAQWSFEYSQDSLNNISKKDLFMYWGAGYEPWIQSFVDELKKGKVGIVNVSRGIRLLSLNKSRKYKDTELKDNPYYWLNPEDYKIALANIKNSVEEKDPINREVYENNYNDAIKRVDRLTKDSKTLSEDLKKFTFITVGDKFDYLTKFLNLKVIKLEEQDYLPQEQEKVLKKIGDSKNLVFLSGEEIKAEKYDELIKKNKMMTVSLVAYEFDMQYSGILESNYASLKKLLQQ